MEQHPIEQLGEENPAPRRMGATLSESEGILEEKQALELATLLL